MLESDSDVHKSSKRPKTTHGGIINQFKAPAQTTEEGIEIENWKSRTGQKFTSLKKLQEASLKKHRDTSKKKD